MRDNNIIKVFVSSTFSDMHRERDLLHPIEGLINKDIENTGYKVQLVDLRYGIDTSEYDEKAAEKKVLDGCFTAIDKCQLFMLILGDRYGTVFDGDNISAIPFEYEEADGKSVTHLELTYGNKKLSPENILIFIRNVKNEKEIPVQYREAPAESKKNKDLKKKLSQIEKYRIDYYNAEIIDGEYHIDEYYFNKHAQGIIEDMVLNYIKKESEIRSVENSSEYVKEKNDELEFLIKNKCANINGELAETYEKLVHLRVEDLLNASDYAVINTMGGTGKSQLDYRKNIVKNLPDNLDELLPMVCNLIADIINEIKGDDIYKSLYLVAYIQNNKSMGIQGLSTKEIESLGFGEKIFDFENSEIIVYDEYLKNKEEWTGLQQKPSPISRALAYFTKYGIMVHSETGYLFESETFSNYLCNVRHYDVCAFEKYGNKVWWFLPGRIQSLADLLKNGQYNTLYDRIEKLYYSDKATDKIGSYLNSVFDSNTLKNLIEHYVFWCIDSNKPVQHIVYVLFDLYYPEEDSIFERCWVSLCENTYNKCKSEVKRSLSSDYTIKYLYDQFSIEQEKPQEYIYDEKEYNDLERLDEALWEMYFCHNLTDDEDVCTYKEAISIIKEYINQWECLCDIFQILKITHHSMSFAVIYNFLPVFLDGTITKEQYQMLIGRMLKSVHSYEELVDDGIALIEEYIIAPLMNNDYYDVALYIFKELYEKIILEEYIRCCSWTKWIWYMQTDLLDDLYEKTKDEIVLSVIRTVEANYFIQSDELEEIDRNLLKEVDITD